MPRYMISIDQSLSSSGVVVWEEGEPYRYLALQTDKSLSEVERLAYIEERLLELFLTYTPKRVVIEGLSYGSISSSVRVLAGLYYLILLHLFRLNIPVSIVPPSALKKFATGSGRAKKKDMFEALPEDIKKELMLQFKTLKSGRGDVTDAYWLGKYDIENGESK